MNGAMKPEGLMLSPIMKITTTGLFSLIFTENSTNNKRSRKQPPSLYKKNENTNKKYAPDIKPEKHRRRKKAAKGKGFTAQEGPNRIGPGRTVLHTNPKKFKKSKYKRESYNPIEILPIFQVGFKKRRTDKKI